MQKFISDQALAAFAYTVNVPDNKINLAQAALAMAQLEYAELATRRYLDVLARLAESARSKLTNGITSPAVALASFLFDELGFRGNTRNYADPRNSFLNDVLDRHLGIPISLSVLYLVVAQHLDVNAYGIGLPGHFIVGANTLAGKVYLDPFHGGIVLNEEDCKAQVARVTQGHLPFQADFLSPVAPRYILTRMLNNLKSHYSSVNDPVRAASVIERLLVLHPTDVLEQRNLGLLYGGMGKKRRAAELLESYLVAMPTAHDYKPVRNYLDTLVEDVSRWN